MMQKLKWVICLHGLLAVNFATRVSIFFFFSKPLETYDVRRYQQHSPSSLSTVHKSASRELQSSSRLLSNHRLPPPSYQPTLLNISSAPYRNSNTVLRKMQNIADSRMDALIDFYNEKPSRRETNATVV